MVVHILAFSLVCTTEKIIFLWHWCVCLVRAWCSGRAYRLSPEGPGFEPQSLHICVGKAWGLKTTLPQTPHSAGSLRHWVRPLWHWCVCLVYGWDLCVLLISIFSSLENENLCRLRSSQRRLLNRRKACNLLKRRAVMIAVMRAPQMM